MTAPLWALSLAEVSGVIRRRDVSARVLTESVLARIAAVEPRLNAFTIVTAEEALAAARQADDEIAAGRWRGPLHGVPVSVKDIFDQLGMRTTAASRFLADAAPSRADSGVVARLRAAGAVLIGRTNLHEFALGGTSQTSHFGPVRNPWNPHRIPGGSSGGSGAAVAAGMGFASIGTDTGGSIRIPAACCGVVGLKPTFGRVSRHGLIPLADSLDHAGPLARTVEDAAIVLAAIAGHDPRDPRSADVPAERYADAIEHGVRGLRIGVLEACLAEADPEVSAAIRTAVRGLEDAGAAVRPMALDLLDAARDAVVVVLGVESAAVHRDRLRDHPDWFGADVRERLLRGQALPAADYERALSLRAAFRAQLGRAFEQVDVLLTPMLLVGAPPIDAATVSIDGRDVDALRAITANTREWNLAGLPAVSVPCGFTADGLPIALQIVGRAFGEATVLRAARAHERHLAGGSPMPPL